MVDSLDIRTLMKIAMDRKASDIYLKVPAVPTLRIDGALKPIEDYSSIKPEDTLRVFESVTTPAMRDKFKAELELDCAVSLSGIARFRVNVSQQRGAICLAFRCVPLEVPTIDQLGLPKVCKSLVQKPRGLVLVTGPTGSGKSTTLAAMIDYINEREKKLIVTIEDPIEYLHSDKKCLISQRDLGDDTISFDSALIHGLRQNPDIIMLGEMRDLTSMGTAITAAETGHLVLSTMHTIGAAASIDRIIDVFPPYQQPQIRSQLSVVLEAVLSQTLIPRADGTGRIAAFEIMLGTYAIGSLIRESRTHEIPGVIETSSKQGMCSLDQSIEALYKSHLITFEEALKRVQQPDDFRKKCQL